MSGASHDEGEDIWQGMVAAVACLLLALLLLMSILALSIMQLGTAKQDSAAPLALAKDKAVVPSKAQWLLRFGAEEVAFDDAQRKQLANEFRPNLIQAALPWRLWVHVSENDDSQQRKAYLRLLAVRGMLMDAGVLPALINLRIVQTPEGTSSVATDPTQVFVSRSLQRSERGTP